MNNFERIKQMNVDEMAEFIDYIGTNSPCYRYCIYKDKPNCIDKEESCKPALTEFLLQECE